MTNVIMNSDITVKLIRSTMSDDSVIQAAQVSVMGENNPETVPARLISALMHDRHGSPFEHNSATFFVKAPLFVFREWQRHRIGSFNEQSGRYTKFEPEFYVPAANRPMIMAEGATQMRPEMELATKRQYDIMRTAYIQSAENAWIAYVSMLNAGIVKEVARGVLGTNIYSSMYWTVNARSLMNFLSLRGSQKGAAVVSYPQWEIQRGAMRVEGLFKTLMPLTWKSFVRNGLVAP